MDGLQVGFHPPAGLQNPHEARLCVILYLTIMPGHFSCTELPIPLLL